MKHAIDGIVPVMITPFTEANAIDWGGLENLVEWYIAHRADALFAVCQSSEMQFLSLEERVELARRTVEMAKGRVPVIASGHVAESLDDQRAELRAIAATGVDGLVLVTNRLDPARTGAEAFRANLDSILSALPSDLPLGLYECPAPYRRLLSDDEFKGCVDTGRFVVLKDVSCDLETVRRRASMAEGSPLNVVNANAAIAFDAMKNGSMGFSGIATNFHPDLYAHLYANKERETPLIKELTVFLALAAMGEAFGYPAMAKLLHVRHGTFTSYVSRAIDYDILERHWALEPLLEHIENGSSSFRNRLRDRPEMN